MEKWEKSFMQQDKLDLLTCLMTWQDTLEAIKDCEELENVQSHLQRKGVMMKRSWSGAGGVAITEHERTPKNRMTKRSSWVDGSVEVTSLASEGLHPLQQHSIQWVPRDSFSSC